MNTSLKETLIQAGFEPSTAEIYLFLLNSGEKTGSEIVKQTNLSRAGVYDALNILLAGDYVTYRKEGKFAYYKAEHPAHLQTLLDKKKESMTLLTSQFSEAISSLSGIYNLTSNKPGVLFYEGIAGIKDALYQTLEATEEIRAYTNLTDQSEEIIQMNADYSKERVTKKIPKKVLMTYSESNVAFMKANTSEFTDIRILPKNTTAFPSSMQIFNNKSIYLSPVSQGYFAVVILDQFIAQMNKSIFDTLWAISLTSEVA